MTTWRGPVGALLGFSGDGRGGHLDVATRPDPVADVITTAEPGLRTTETPPSPC